MDGRWWTAYSTHHLPSAAHRQPFRMNPITVFFKGISHTFRLFWMWLLLFLLIFVLGLTVAVPFAGIMEESIGNSLEISKLLPAYDHTVWTDFMNAHGDKISGLTSQVRWMVPVFLLAYIFLSGGIVKSFATLSEGFSGQRVMAACTQYFWRFFRLFAWVMLFQGLVAALLYGGAFLVGLGGDFGNLRSEAIFTDMGKIILPIHLFLATFIAMVGDYTKVRIVKNERYNWFVIADFWRSLGMCLRYFFRMYFVYLLDIALLVGVYALYLFLAPKIGMTGKAAILIMLIVQTLVMFFRLGTRLFAIGSANAMYDGIHRKENPQIVEEIREDEQAVVAPVPIIADEEQEAATIDDDEFDEEDQQYNEREHIIDWTPYQDE